ncbi:MAG: sulfite exporter TauE/SafE family protein [Planctomycetaceae bacterium]|jgi:uncharacterized membrane protein YfcA|nr:sulfite exporter TauE/SafE family protein [Planctomycetaceae bacterium]
MSWEQIFPFVCGTIAAFFIGLSKTGIPGLSLPGILLMTFAFPGNERFSTGAILPVLIIGDIVGLSLYRKNIQWRILAVILPFMFVGIIFGSYILAKTPDKYFQPTLAIVVCFLILFDVCRQYFKWEKIGNNLLFAPTFGITTGLTTMYANAGGPPMYVYLTAQNLRKEQYMATWVWIFCIGNLIKLPISCSLGMINTRTLYFTAYNLLPGLLIGVLIGRRVFLLIPEKYFVPVTFFGTLLTAIGMMLQIFGLGK